MSLLRISPALREVRLILCQTSTASAGVRQFVNENYVNIKTEHPTLPFLVRECSEVKPMLYGRLVHFRFSVTLLIGKRVYLLKTTKLLEEARLYVAVSF